MRSLSVILFFFFFNSMTMAQNSKIQNQTTSTSNSMKQSPEKKQTRQMHSKSRKPASLRITEALFIGHNLTPSTEVAGKYKVTLGNYALGFGLTENILVAISPWILYSYNTTNFHVKYSKPISARSTGGVFFSYFDSYNSESLMGQAPYGSGTSPVNSPFSSALPDASSITPGTNRYQWTSYSAHGLFSYIYADGITQYFNLKYSYFLNDEMPYSLRMDPGEDSIRDQVDISTLMKIPLEQKVSLALESGVLGANYKNPYAHFGASLVVQKPEWLIQFGASYTAPLNELGQSSSLQIGRMDQRLHYSSIANQYYRERYLQVAVHPEIQIQFNF